MIKEELAKLILNFVSVPDHYDLLVEEYSQNEAKFMWGTSDLEEGIGLTLDGHGRLLSFSKPPSKSGEVIPVEQRQSIAERFFLAQYEDALQYLTLSQTIEREDETRFIYKQYAGGYPLASFTSKIAISKYGEVIEFRYDGYTKTPPVLPDKLINKEAIFQQIYKAKWSLSLQYLYEHLHSVPSSGLYALYESPIVYQSFDAVTGMTCLEHNEEVLDTYLPFPKIEAYGKSASIEEIIGVSNTMEKLRESELDDGIGIVWREKAWKATTDKTLDSFLFERIEDTVKAKVNKETHTLKEFIWFKERLGDLQLSFEACQDIACAFITTYFFEYIPFLKLKVSKPEFNQVHRAFFTFPLHDSHGQIIDGEQFYVGVNRTTGLIDILRSPRIDLAVIQAFDLSSVQPLESVLEALGEVDAFLTWDRQYEEEALDVLHYELYQKETKKRILGIDAVSGTLIVSKLFNK